MANSIAFALALTTPAGFAQEQMGNNPDCASDKIELKADNQCQEQTNEYKSNKKNEALELVDLKYPIELKNIQVFDPATGKPYPVEMTATNNSEFYLNASKRSSGDSIDVKSNTILEWGVGDFSQTKFSGGAAAASTVGWLAGSAIGIASGGMAIPLLLALPFIFGSSNQYTPDHRVGIKLIDETGREQQIIIQAFNKQDTNIIRTLLQTGTGLKATQRRTENELVTIRQSALIAQEKLLGDEKQPLIVVNAKKQWCSYLDLSGRYNSTEVYTKVLANVNNLRAILAQTKYLESESRSSSQKWNEHLDANPGLKAWVKANPKAAANLSECPETTTAL